MGSLKNLLSNLTIQREPAYKVSRLHGGHEVYSPGELSYKLPKESFMNRVKQNKGKILLAAAVVGILYGGLKYDNFVHREPEPVDLPNLADVVNEGKMPDFVVLQSAKDNYNITYDNGIPNIGLLYPMKKKL